MGEPISIVRTSDAVRSGATASLRQPADIADLHRWAFEQAGHIRAGRFDQIDLLNVADEIEDVGKSEFRSLVSNIEIVLTHMLKWEHQPAKRSRSWALSIMEHRDRIHADLADSPSMDARWAGAVERAYKVARVRAARETHLPLSAFPALCPYDRNRIMDALYAVDDTAPA